MNVYFTASSSEEDKQTSSVYSIILNSITSLDHKVTNPYFKERFLDGSKKQEKISIDDDVFNILRRQIVNSDCVVTEISTPSISLGIQIEYALTHKIPVLCLLKNGQSDGLPLMMRNYKNSLLTKQKYTSKNIKGVLTDFFKNFPKSRVKFNMFIDHEIDRYLSYLSKKQNKPKSKIIRDLIAEKMESDSVYSSQ